MLKGAKEWQQASGKPDQLLQHQIQKSHNINNDVFSRARK